MTEETMETQVAEGDTKDTGGTVWDAPNQQVVRPDESPPWQEGSGGSATKEQKKQAKQAEKEQAKAGGVGVKEEKPKEKDGR